MPLYRAYSITADGRRSGDVLERGYDEDSDVRAWARVMMADNRSLAGVEVWCGERLVFELRKPPS